MPVLDGNFEAFVTNLGKYNEGELVGEWVKFPISAEEMQKVFERIGIGSKDEFGQPYEEWFITDYECPVSGVYDMLGEYENIDKLNYLAARIDEMDKWDQEKFAAIMEAGCDEVSDIAVSYTHLVVYKRQPLYRRNGCMKSRRTKCSNSKCCLLS